MARQAKTILVLLCGLAGGTSARADMVPIFPSADGYEPALTVGEPVALPHLYRPRPLGGPEAMAPPWVWFDTQLPVETEIQPAAPMEPALIQADRQDSFRLCLYALLSLGMWRSTPLVKKLSANGIPSWYRAGGPFRTGVSLAFAPDCPWSAPVHCFVQPDSTAALQDAWLPCGAGIVMSFWRKLQFTPAILVPRGPPYLS